MRKTFSLISAISVSSTFSFYKMSDVVLFESQLNQELNSGAWSINSGSKELLFRIPIPSAEYVNVINTQELSPDKSYNYYVYNEQLKYGFIGTSDPHQRMPEKFELLKRRVFDCSWWENYFISDLFKNMHCFLFQANLPDIGAFEVLNNNIKSHKISNCIYVSSSPQFDCPSSFNSTFCLKMQNSKEGVKLSGSEGNTIDFEKAFKNYVRKQKSLYDDNLFQHVVQFIHDKKLIVNDTDPIKTSSISKIINVSKVTYTEDQLNLLENSKILAIWALPEKTYSNKDYIKWLNEQHRNRKNYGSKIIGQIMK